MKLFNNLTAIFCVLCSLALAEPEKLEPTEGVEIGKVKYYEAVSQPDPDLERALVDNLGVSTGDEFRYLYNHVSLRPGADQVLVIVWGSMFSGSGGSTGVLLERSHGASYKIINQFSLFQNPVLVTRDLTNGWHDLILRVSGGGMMPQYSRLKHGTNGYPENPSEEPAVPSGSSLTGTAYLATQLGPEEGHYVMAP